MRKTGKENSGGQPTWVIDDEKVTITGRDPDNDIWLGGRVNSYPEYTFSAKVFDVGSEDGINGGGISKLLVLREDSPATTESDLVEDPETRAQTRNCWPFPKCSLLIGPFPLEVFKLFQGQEIIDQDVDRTQAIGPIGIAGIIVMRRLGLDRADTTDVTERRNLSRLDQILAQIVSCVIDGGFDLVRHESLGRKADAVIAGDLTDEHLHSAIPVRRQPQPQMVALIDGRARLL